MATQLNTFRLRLTLIVGGLSLAIGVAVVFLLSQMASSRITQNSADSLKGVARAVSFAMAENLRERDREIALLSQTALLTQSNLPVPQVRERLMLSKKTYRYYDWLGVAAPDGRVLAGTNGLLEDESVAQRPWFIAGKNGAFIGDVHEAVLLAKKLNNPNPREPLRFVDFASPIIGHDGTLLGVLGSHANWSWVGDVIHGAVGEGGLGNGVEILIAGKNGDILYPFSAIGQVTLPADLPRHNEHAVVRWGDDAFLTTQIALKPSTATNPGWHVIARQPLSQALAAVHAMNVMLLLAGLVATVFFMFVVYRLVVNFCGPLEQLAAAARQVSAGNENPDFSTAFKTAEIQDLTLALQHMLTTLIARRHALEESYHVLEQKVDERTQALSNLYNHAPVGYHSITPEGIIERMNDRELRWLGYEREEVVGKMHIRNLLPPACEAVFLERQRSMSAGEQLPPLDIQLCRKDGTLFPVRISSTAVFDEAGRFILSRTAVMDATELRALEQALRKQEALNQAIIHATANGLLLYRAEGECILANEAAANIVGTSVNALLQQNFHQLASWKACGWYDAALQALAGQETQIVVSTASSFGKRVDSMVTQMALQHDGETFLLVVVKDVSELIAANRELEQLARYDALTGLFNRLALNERLREEFLRMKRSGTCYSVLLADVDHFKRINDTFGHETGDAVLQQLGQRLKSLVRATDFVARYGGEEFLLILPDTPLDSANIFAEKLRQAVAETAMPVVGQISLSIGLAAASPEDESEDLTVSLADLALYEAKAAGRNAVRWSQPHPAAT